MGMKRIAATLLATSALVAGAVELDANLTARAMLRRALDKHAGLGVAAIFAEPITGRLYLRGVTAAQGTTRVAVGNLTLPLPRLSLISPAMASPFDDAPEKEPEAAPEAQPEPTPTPAPKAEATPATKSPPAASATPAPATGNGVASADNIVVTSGQTTIRIKHVDMTGTALTGADIAALVDPASTVPAEARLKKLTATAIIVPEILVDDATPGSERHVAINQVLLSGAVAGKIAAGSAAGVALTSKQGEGSSTGTVGGIQATAVDLVQIARVFSTVRSDDAEPIRPLYDSVTVNTIKIADEAKKTVLSLSVLKETGAKARPLATDFIAGGKGHTEKMTEAQKAATFNDMTSSFEIGTIEATDFAVKSEKDGASEFALSGVAINGFAKGKVGGFGLRAVRFASPDVAFGIGSVDVGEFALPKPKGSLTDQDPKTLVPSLAKIDIRQVDFDVLSDKNKPEGPTRVKFKLAHSGLTSDGDAGELPRSSKLTIDNLTFDIPPGATQGQALVDMGYKHLDLSGVVATSYDASAQALNIDHFTLSGVEMGTADLGLNLINVSKGIISPNQEIAKASALAMLLKGLKLDLTNTGLVDRALAWKAKQDGIGVEDERKIVVDFLGTKLPASMNNNANLKIIGEAAAKFVAAPKTLHVAIVSKSGLGAGSMALLSDPGLLLDTLDVKASAND